MISLIKCYEKRLFVWIFIVGNIKNYSHFPCKEVNREMLSFCFGEMGERLKPAVC